MDLAVRVLKQSNGEIKLVVLIMPSYPSQDALVYIDLSTRGYVFFHADNVKLWSAAKLSELEMSAILNNTNFENLN